MRTTPGRASGPVRAWSSFTRRWFMEDRDLASASRRALRAASNRADTPPLPTRWEPGSPAMMRRFVPFVAAALLGLGGCATIPTTPASHVASDGVGAVSAADPRAAEAGASIIRQGGSAVDAAIATMLALNVVE